MSLSVLAMLSVAATLSGQKQDLSEWVQATQITLVRTPLDSPAVQFTLENRSGKDITAWGADLRCTRPDGTTHTRFYVQETLGSYERLTAPDVRSRKVLLAHGAITPVVALEPSGCADVSVSVSFLVFADRRSIGDPRAIHGIFEERDRASRAWTVILTALRLGQAAGDNDQGVGAALQYLNSPNQEDFDQSDKRLMRGQLQTALVRGRGVMTIDQYLTVLVDRAQRSLEAVNKHKR